MTDTTLANLILGLREGESLSFRASSVSPSIRVIVMAGTGCDRFNADQLNPCAEQAIAHEAMRRLTRLRESYSATEAREAPNSDHDAGAAIQ